MLHLCQSDAYEKFGGLSDGEIKDYDQQKCVDIGGHHRYHKMNESSKEKLRCEIAHDYYCLQAKVVSTVEEIQKLNGLKCVELHSDFIIHNFDSIRAQKELQETVSQIRKIRGRLIIDGNQLPVDLSFDKLEDVGDFIFMGQSPLIQITNNRVNSIKFPRLKQVHCLKNRRRKCVVIGGNWRVNGSEPTEIIADEQNMDVSGFFNTEVRVKLMEGKRKEVIEVEEVYDVEWMTMDEYEEIGMMSSQHEYTFEDFYAKFFVSSRYVHALVALLFFILAGAVIVSTVYRPKRKTLRLLSEKYEYKDNWGREFVPLE